MLRRLSLQNFVIVVSLDLDLTGGFSVLTGETGAGKSILIDALQLVLGGRGDAGVVREGAARTEIVAEWDTPKRLQAWLDEAGFEIQDALLVRRVIDAQGKSRAWINGGVATVAQLREMAAYLVDIHGQHAWQHLTQSDHARELLDGYAGIDTAALTAAWSRYQQARKALEQAINQQDHIEREREQLAWQVGEIDKLNPGQDEWDELNAHHRRLAHAQALIEAAQQALDHVRERQDSASALSGRALSALQAVAEFDGELAAVAQVLESAQAQLQDAAHSLNGYLHHLDVQPDQLALLDVRLSQWIGLAKRYRCAPADLPAAWLQAKTALAQLDEQADLAQLQTQRDTRLAALVQAAKTVSQLRQRAAPLLSSAITQAMQQLGMLGGVFEVALVAQDAPQSFGAELVEFLVCGHTGGTPKPLAKVASGGELSRIALAMAVTSRRLQNQAQVDTLIFVEIDAGIGGAVADTVGRLMKQLGYQDRQVLAVTHLPQVAACADHHFVVTKQAHDGQTQSDIRAVNGTERVSEIARMLGASHLSSTSLAHASEMLAAAQPSPALATSKKKS